MTNKNILIWETLPMIGGGQRVSLQVANALIKNGNNVEFIIPGSGPLEDELRKVSISYYIIAAGNYSLGRKNILDCIKFSCFSLAIIFRVSRLIKKNKYDVLYAGGAWAFIWSAVLGLLCRIDIVWHVHHVFTDKRIVRLVDKISSLKSVQRVICVSECVRDQFERIRKKAVIINNGVEVEKFQNAKGDAVRLECGISDSSIVISAIGLLQPSKRQDYLISSFIEFAGGAEDAYLLIVGPEREQYNDYCQKLKSFVSERCEDRILFLGNRNDVPNILKASTITVVLGEEGCPLIVLESCASGTPVLASNIAGASELVSKAQCGMMYDYYKPETLGDVMDEMINDASALKKYSENGLLFAKNNDMTCFRKNIIQLFNTGLPV